MNDADLRALIITLVLGTFIAATGATALFFAFRRFGERGAGGSSHMAFIGALIAFVFAACGLLLFLSYRW